MRNRQPIGLFDSGIGGTSIWKEIHTLLPNENTIYLADSLNAPYGQRSKDEIISLCFKNIDLLIQKNCKLIVVACNTATTNAINEIREYYNSIPIIGIEPAIKPAASLTKNSKIGILATKGTISSDLFASKVKSYTNVTIYEQIGYNLVQLIETGQINSPQMIELLNSYLQPMVQKGIDTLVLGCTHYPYLKPIIETLIPKSIIIIDSGKAVAKQTKHILLESELLSDSTNIGTSTFYTNTNPEILKTFTPSDSIIEFLDF
ncbi:glutamate racemase [Myroides guanonis]|uniref:Glutamate racemase n=1 Tax=Myroides guanonis TaxID=1150112 RepID=A0A1I3NT94_9FLAO|nr:glutamate racemase [Myroides guanonis]SFJ12501.1 glutamate racemase [Myroides guanonis]